MGGSKMVPIVLTITYCGMINLNFTPIILFGLAEQQNLSR